MIEKSSSELKECSSEWASPFDEVEISSKLELCLCEWTIEVKFAKKSFLSEAVGSFISTC